MTEALSILPNPHRSKCYVVSLIEEITVEKKKYLLGLRYVPDKLLVDHESLRHYLIQILGQNSGKSESLAHEILEDMMNQIIPRWIEISLMQKMNKYGQKIMITMEDRQPDFNDNALLDRLPDIF